MQLQAGCVVARHEPDLPRAALARLVAVDVVAENREAHGGAVHPQLMRAAGDGFEREPGETALHVSMACTLARYGLRGLRRLRGSRRAPHHLPFRHRRLAGRVGLHPPAELRIEPPERHVDGALLALRPAVDHRPVGLADAAMLEQQAEAGERLAMTPQHEAARGLAIEPMRQFRTARQAIAQMLEPVLKARTTFRPAMHREPGRLVDHQHQPVAVQDAREDFLLGRVLRIELFRRFHVHAETAITAPAMNDTPKEAPKKSWFARLTGGLKRTSATIGGAISDLVSRRKLDAATIEELEELLIRADLGVDVSARIAAAIGKGRFDKMVSDTEVKAILAAEVEKVLSPVAKPLVVDPAAKPFVILVVGVNGSGKTTTIGKLAARFRAERRNVMLAAGDTFRAAAIEQLKIWGERTGATVIAREQGSDAASLAFEAVSAAKAEGADILIMDTAGRLQNRTELMAELEKIVRVMKKVDPAAPHAVPLVLDATVGQNALSQVEVFRDIAGVTGLVMTKLDGTARGGILVAIAAKFGLPVHFIGVGESIDDLAPFSARDFARAIAGVEE